MGRGLGAFVDGLKTYDCERKGDDTCMIKGELGSAWHMQAPPSTMQQPSPPFVIVHVLTRLACTHSACMHSLGLHVLIQVASWPGLRVRSTSSSERHTLHFKPAFAALV